MDGRTVRVTRSVDGVPDTALYEAVGSNGALLSGTRVAVIGLMHGNEPVGAGALELVEATVRERLLSGSLLTVRANPVAAGMGLRHTPDGEDMNRLWAPHSMAIIRAKEPQDRCYEERRVLELADLILGCDAIVDLHSTSRPTEPFLLFRDDQQHATLARLMGVPHLVTGLHENAILDGGLCSNAGIAPGERGKRLGFTFEAGQHSSPTNVERAFDVVQRLLSALGMWLAPDLAPTVETGSVYEVVERFAQAGPGHTPYRFVGYRGGEPGAGRTGPPRALHSFETVQADEVLLRRGRNEVVRAQAQFTMLMPAPDAAPKTDLFYLTQARHGGLAEGVHRTDEQAGREALAIERMLDLLADDDFARGSTWVGFDSRQLLDLCASVVSRTRRLPEGSPDRRIVVVGRGDVGGDEVERRTGQRYRQAMRRAVSVGVPVERIQLLRGASLGWLDALTSHTMLDLMKQRRARGGDPVSMRVSLNHPHTLSLLAVGDLERALETGNTRHVRVALLVEAASIAPQGDTAVVRTLRAGIVSGRPELISAALALLEALRAEHEHQVRYGSLGRDGSIRSLLLPDHALEARPDPADMWQLRAALYRLQLRLWCDGLKHHVDEPIRVPRGELGGWLTRTMVATGILDTQTLHDLVVRSNGTEWLIEPDEIHRLQALAESPDTPIEDLPQMMTPALPPSPPQPLDAEDVDADTLERWVGWKRFVRSVQVIPDTRGKDLDLAFTDSAIRMRMARWFDHARTQAARHPGDVLVVVAGDGLNPARDQVGAWELLTAHKALLRDPRVQYLRVQHAAGTHLSWLKDFVAELSSRPPGGAPVSLAWEVEHGSSLNVVLVATRHQGDAIEPRPWSLDGWSIERCGVVLSDLAGGGTVRKVVGLFTARLHGGQVNSELLHFGREHCEGLLKQEGWRIRGVYGPPAVAAFDACLVDQIAGWIERVRGWKGVSRSVPEPIDERARWVSARLGLVDERLSRALAVEMYRDTAVRTAAQDLWRSVPAWPGVLASGMQRVD